MQSILKTLKSAFPLTLLALFLILAACATDPGTGGGSGGNGGGGNGGGGNSGGSGEVAVKKANIDVKGTKKDVLTTVDGHTLYYFKKDSSTTAACTGDCASTWPPYLFKGTGTPATDGADNTKLQVVNTTNGAQLSYNGHLLYTFASDKPGDAGGEGLGGNWFVVEP